MIKAAISPWHEALFRPYIRRLLKKNFNTIHLLGEVPEFADKPILLLPNHSTWWDGFFIHLLKEKVFKRPGYLMMLEEQLVKNRFFAKVGAFSIEPASAKSCLLSLLYSRDLLQNSAKPFVCIFPQGVLLPWGVRPLGYKRGIDLIVRKMNIPLNVCQLSIKCEYLHSQRAEVFLQFGENRILAPGETLDIPMLERAHEKQLENLARQILNGEKGRVLLRGERSVNEMFEVWRRKLGLLRGKK